MASVQHSAIVEADLHESKGVSTAVANKLYHTNGAGSGTWYYPMARGSVSFVNLTTPSVLTTPTIYTKIAPATVVSGLPVEMSEATTARLTYTGTPNRNAHLKANFTIDQTSAAVRTVNAAVYKNGTIIANTEIQQVLTTADKVNVSMQSDGAVATNDYYELYVKITGTGNVQVYSLNMSLICWI